MNCKILSTLTSLFFILCYNLLSAQPVFQKTIGGNGNDQAKSVIQTTDGGYVLCGKYQSAGNGNDVYVVKLDSDGSLQWTKTIGGSGSDVGECVIQTSDGGYAICGSTNSFGAGGDDVYMVKLDGSGNLQWTKTIGGNGNDRGKSVMQTADSSYVICGSTNSFGAGDDDVYVVKLDGSGNLLWSKAVGGSGNDSGESITQAIQGSDTLIAVIGYTNSLGPGGTDVYLIQLDDNGNLLWTRTIDGGGNEEACSVTMTTHDGGLVATGSTEPLGATNSKDVYVIKLDSLGNVIWTTKTIGGNSDDLGKFIIQSKDGGYAIAGYTASFGSVGWDIYVIKLDSSGNLEWTKTMGGSGWDFGYSIVQSNDGGYVIGGETNSFGADSNDVYVVKLDNNGSTCGTAGNGGIVSTGSLATSTGDTIANVSSSVDSGGTVSSGGLLTDVCYTCASDVFFTIGNDTVCNSDSAFPLTGGLPAGGIYSGPGISNNNFDPNVAGSGWHDIVYSYTYSSNCIGSDTSRKFVDVCTGIHSVEINKEIVIYPNPAIEIIHVIIHAINYTIRDIIITDISGKIILQTKQTEIPVAHLSKGLYFVRVEIENGEGLIRKIVVQ